VKVKECLTALEADEYCTGPGWTRAHDICQAHEGELNFDRIHALIHRIEGDDANARYWYRRAGVPPFEGSFAEEARLIGQEVGLPGN
jgi:LPS sulfotransferase NodH